MGFSKLKFFQISAREISIIFLLYVIPLMFIFKNYDSIEAFAGYLKDRIPTETIINYNVIMLLFYLIVSLLRYFFRGKLIGFFHDISAKAGAGIVGIYRVLTGVCLIFIVLWVKTKPTSVDKNIIIFIIGFFAFYFFCIIFSLFDEFIQSKFRQSLSFKKDIE